MTYIWRTSVWMYKKRERSGQTGIRGYKKLVLRIVNTRNTVCQVDFFGPSRLLVTEFTVDRYR